MRAFRHTEDPSVPSYGATVTWCGIGVCGLDVRMQTVGPCVWSLSSVLTSFVTVCTLIPEAYDAFFSDRGDGLQGEEGRRGGGFFFPLSEASTGRRGRPERRMEQQKEATSCSLVASTQTLRDSGKCGYWQARRTNKMV